MQLFYSSSIRTDLKQFSFTKEESKHMVKVLRKKEGDKLYITNGQGILFMVNIIDGNPKKCTVIIDEIKSIPKTRNYQLHLVIAPTKLNERFEWFLEKAIEIGVDEITPVICERSERKVLKLERMHKVMISAIKQSLQFYLPKLNAPVSLADFLKMRQTGSLFVAHCQEGHRIDLAQKISSDQEKFTILIGPEGDFSNTEIETAIKAGYAAVSLGNNRLRTETAGIVACHSISLLKNLY